MIRIGSLCFIEVEALANYKIDWKPCDPRARIGVSGSGLGFLYFLLLTATFGKFARGSMVPELYFFRLSVAPFFVACPLITEVEP